MAENELIKILYATLSPDLATRQAAESALELGASQEGVSRRGGQSRIQSCCLTAPPFVIAGSPSARRECGRGSAWRGYVVAPIIAAFLEKQARVGWLAGTGEFSHRPRLLTIL